MLAAPLVTVVSFVMLSSHHAPRLCQGDVVTAWSLLDGAEVQLVVGTPAGDQQLSGHQAS